MYKIGIYCFTNKLNNKRYIGQSIHIEKRYKEHLKASLYSKTHSLFYNAIKKYVQLYEWWDAHQDSIYNADDIDEKCKKLANKIAKKELE